MPKWDKQLTRIYALSKNLRPDELRRVLESYGYEMKAPRTGSSHYIFRKPGSLEEYSKYLYLHVIRTGKPVFCIVDGTIASKTKPSSQALHPLEDVYFHQSHLKGKQDYGHQAVAVMLSCNGIVLNHAVVMYDKSIPKIEIVEKIAEKLPALHHCVVKISRRCTASPSKFCLALARTMQSKTSISV